MQYATHQTMPKSAVQGIVFNAADDQDTYRQKMARIILDSMYQFLGLLDVQGTVLEVNQAALAGAGLALSDVVGQPFWQAKWWTVSPEIQQRLRQMIEKAAAGEFVRCDVEVLGEQQGTSTIVIDFSLTPIYDDTGKVAFILPEGRNITEKIGRNAELSRKNSELQTALEKLRELDQFKTRFFSNVSHELRTPLALIIGPVDQLLKSTQSLDEQARFRLSTVQRNAYLLLEQVNNLLDLACIDADRMPISYSRVRLRPLIQEIAAGFESVIIDRQIKFTIRGADLTVDIDRSKMVRVLINIFANAFKYVPDAGRISCSLQHIRGERLLISIQDNGPGVPDALKSQIFDRFTQGNSPPHQDNQAAEINQIRFGSSGLGLNIAKEFVDLHHGALVVLDAPGGGAVFQIEIPIHAPADVVVQVSDEESVNLTAHHFPLSSTVTRPPPTTVTTNKPKILIVEDNPDLRYFLYDVLCDDYNVCLCADGESAYQTAMADPPDLIITDLMMPRWDGERFVRALGEAANFPEVPILVLSARADDALRERLLSRWVKDYLTKPFSPEELRARVRNWVTMKRSVDILQKELNSQTSNILELTADLVHSRRELQHSLTAIQVSDRRWLGIYENTAVGIALADRDGKILQANPALRQMLGYDEEEIVGVSLIDITEPTNRALTRQQVHGLCDGALSGYQVKKRYEKHQGGYLWANVCVSRIPAMAEDNPMLAVIVEDISLHMQAERSLAVTRTELARVARFTAMGELVATIAHEINQPLSAVITNTDAALRWLNGQPADLGEVAAALKRVNRDALLASRVITRIRSFLKFGEIHREQVDVGHLIEELLQMLLVTISEAAVRVDTELPVAGLTITTDPVLLQQVILNLVVNSIDAMRLQQEKRLLIKVTAADHIVHFTVKDNGPGILAETAEKLFDPFFSTKTNGLGMGLAISRTIIENQGGRLWLANNAAGEQGACFCFTIPL